jgi:Fe-S cluster assembly iron-binding protein IscA
MDLTFTPLAARKVLGIISAKGGNLALRVKIQRSLTGSHSWSMGLEHRTSEAIMVGNVPIMADQMTRSHLDGLMIDWLITPEGEGFGVYDRSLQKRDLKLGAD